ncbi:MAG: type VII toxin-antitoxin system MntA family adenylyltransferase antitoxin [Gammaproteobacteria bacterium]
MGTIETQGSGADHRGDGTAATDDIVRAVLGHYPDTQAIYLFGSYGTENEWPDSDVDIALLLRPEQAKASRMLAMSPLCSELGSLFGKVVDLINLREVSTVFQKRDHHGRPAYLYGRRLWRGRVRDASVVVLSEARRGTRGHTGGVLENG